MQHLGSKHVWQIHGAPNFQGCWFWSLCTVNTEGRAWKLMGHWRILGYVGGSLLSTDKAALQGNVTGYRGLTRARGHLMVGRVSQGEVREYVVSSHSVTSSPSSSKPTSLKVSSRWHLVTAEGQPPLRVLEGNIPVQRKVSHSNSFCCSMYGCSNTHVLWLKRRSLP